MYKNLFYTWGFAPNTNYFFVPGLKAGCGNLQQKVNKKASGSAHPPLKTDAQLAKTVPPRSFVAQTGLFLNASFTCF